MDEEEDLVVVDDIDPAGNLVRVPVPASQAQQEIQAGTAIPVTEENAGAVEDLQNRFATEQQTPQGMRGAATAGSVGALDALSFGFFQRTLQSVSPGDAAVANLLREQNPGSTTAGYVLGMVLPALFSGGSSTAAQGLRLGTAGGLTRFAGDALRRSLVRRLGSRRAAQMLSGAGEGFIGGVADNLIRTNTRMEAIDGERLVADGIFGAALGLGVGGLLSVGDDILRGGRTTALSVRQAQELADRGLWEAADTIGETITTPSGASRALGSGTQRSASTALATRGAAPPVPAAATRFLSAENPSFVTLSQEMQSTLGGVARAQNLDDFLVAASNQSDLLAERISQGGPQVDDLVRAQETLVQSIDEAISGAAPGGSTARSARSAADDMPPAAGFPEEEIIEGEVIRQRPLDGAAPPNAAGAVDDVGAPPRPGTVRGENGDFGGGSFGREAPPTAGGRAPVSSKQGRDLTDVLLNHLASAAGFGVGSAVSGSPLVGAATAFFARKAAPHIRQMLARGGMASTQVRFEAGVREVGRALVQGARNTPPEGGVLLGSVTFNSIRDVEQREQQYETVTTQLRDLVSNPAALQERLASTFGRAEAGGEGLSGYSMDVAVRGVNHLVTNLPQASRPTPFDHLGKVQPTMAEMNDFLARYETIEDPLIIFDKIQSRTLTRAHVEAMSEVYPQMYAATRQRISELLADLQTMPAYQDRLILGQLLQFPADPTLSGEFIAAIQNTYAQTQQQREQAPQRAGGSSLSMSIANNTQSESLEIRTSP